MKQVTLQEIGQIAASSREALWEDAKSAGLDCPKLVLHWTAGHYDQLFPEDYHISITGGGAIIASTEDLSDYLPHTWHLNTGTVGITLCCAVGADTKDLGDEPPTEEQIEVMAQVIAVLCANLWLTCDRQDIVMTHGEAGDSTDLYEEDELYGPNNDCERWDLQYLGTEESPEFTADHSDPSTGGNVIRAKAAYYQRKFNKAAMKV